MLLIVDANVLIAYLDTDRSVLALAAKHLGSVHVPRVVLDEVDQLDSAECDRLGLVVVEATTEQLLEAGEAGGALSFEDKICLYLARDNGWTCVTNDAPLHRACAAAGVASMWGLELMLGLVDLGQLPSDEAIRVAEQIREASAGRIKPEMMAEFRKRAGRTPPKQR